MGEIVNLHRARKRKARANADSENAAKRSTHGVSKADRLQAKAARVLAEHRLEGHRRESEPD
jgi:Domain of unknown function (DUF4169)